MKKYNESLTESELGKSKSAYGAIKLMKSFVNSDIKSIKKVLTDKENEEIV